MESAKFQVGQTVKSLTDDEGIIIDVSLKPTKQFIDGSTNPACYLYTIRTKDGRRVQMIEDFLEPHTIDDIEPISDKDFKPLFSEGDLVTSFSIQHQKAIVKKFLGNNGFNGERLYEIVTEDGNTHQIIETILNFYDVEKESSTPILSFKNEKLKLSGELEKLTAQLTKLTEQLETNSQSKGFAPIVQFSPNKYGSDRPGIDESDSDDLDKE